VNKVVSARCLAVLAEWNVSVAQSSTATFQQFIVYLFTTMLSSPTPTFSLDHPRSPYFFIRLLNLKLSLKQPSITNSNHFKRNISESKNMAMCNLRICTHILENRF